ncbi:hypothetical protein D3C71_1568510 [compost metagenome]
MQGARQRGLEVHAVAAHPGSAGGGFADHQARQVFVGQPARHLEQVLPELFLRVGIDQHVLRRIVHAAQVAGVGGIAAAPGAWGGFEQQHAGARLARHQGSAQGGIAAADDQYIDHSIAAHGWWLQAVRCEGGNVEGGVGPMGCLLARSPCRSSG